MKLERCVAILSGEASEVDGAISTLRSAAGTDAVVAAIDLERVISLVGKIRTEGQSAPTKLFRADW